ncbi:hypothetical protein J2Z49_000258 [Desulfofundulus luciae]|uniref:Lipoprotein n=1 Tax=Desulfofundulus luciae TaxID=74702 RepID=A0ABU0AY39_9FIRM|nr:hypothetical protein [Desulfofundulus luciae]MDQ0285168.1 hypothetical protein [Desulfofundulus luciae]
MKTIYRCVILSIVIIIALVSGCSFTKIKSDNILNNGSNIINKDANIDGAFTTKLGANKEVDSIKIIEDFIKSIKNNDAEALKRITSPSGLIIIRNFSSGSGARGKDIRNLYLPDEIPSNLQFEVSGEVPIILHDLFKKEQIGIKDMPVERLNDLNFNFKDDSKSNILGPPTDEVRDICGKITSTKDTNNQYSSKIFRLGDKEIVLTESALVADSPIGVWAVFEKLNGKYFLRAVIDLR